MTAPDWLLHRIADVVEAHTGATRRQADTAAGAIGRAPWFVAALAVPPPADAAPRDEDYRTIETTLLMAIPGNDGVSEDDCMDALRALKRLRAATPPGGDGGALREALTRMREGYSNLIEYSILPSQYYDAVRELIRQADAALAARAPTGSGPDAAWRQAVATVRARYPESVFTPPPEGTAPDCYAAAGARLACDSILNEVAALRATGAGTGEPPSGQEEG